MKFMTGNGAAVRMLFLVFGVIVLFCCSFQEDDMREKTITELGPPDEIQSGGYGVDEYQIYYYDNKSIDRAYVYRKSAPGCGSSGNWYIYNTYLSSYLDRDLYVPPTIVHSPVKSSPAGAPVKITATITDDNYVKSAVVYYRALADTSFLPVTMSNVDSSYYSADIPAERVTTSGLEYYIIAYDAAHSSRLPNIKGTYRITVSPAAAKVVGEPVTTSTPSPSRLNPVSRERSIITQ